jgi:hypothetical protein
VNPYYILTFETVTQAMAAETVLSTYGGSIIPSPPELQSGCGFAVRLPLLPPPDIVLNHTGRYKVTGRGNGRVIEVL